MTDTLTELKRLHAEATQGEWDYVDSVVWIATHDSHGEPVKQKVADTGDEADAALIVAARNALPSLLAIADAAEKVEAARSRMHTDINWKPADWSAASEELLAALAALKGGA